MKKPEFKKPVFFTTAFIFAGTVSTTPVGSLTTAGYFVKKRKKL